MSNEPKHQNKEDLIRELWDNYTDTKSVEARNSLVLMYAPLIKFVVGRIAARLPQSVDPNDLMSYGVFGLISAIERFDRNRDIKFETYAVSRIRGAVIDELRALDWVPRSVRQKAKEVEGAMAALEQRLKRTPNDEEVASELHITLDDLNDTVAKISGSSMLALEEFWRPGGDNEKIALIDTIEDKESADPSAMFEGEEMKRVLKDAIKSLTEKEQTVIALYYYDGLTLKEIGDVLQVTESRVSQLHTKAILRLKASFKKLAGGEIT